MLIRAEKQNMKDDENFWVKASKQFNIIRKFEINLEEIDDTFHIYFVRAPQLGMRKP